MSQELKRSMVDGGLWTTAGRVVAIAAAFVLNLALARALSPADYGVYFVVLSTMVILATVATAGMDQVVVRFVSACRAMSDRAGMRTVIVRCFGIVLAMTLVVCSAFWQLTPWFFAQVMNMPAVIVLGGLMVAWLFFSTLQRLLAETFRGLNDIRCATLFGGFRNNGILISLITCGGSLALWAAGAMTLEAAFVLTVCASVFVVAVAAWTLWRRLRLMGGEAPSTTQLTGWNIARALHEAWPLWLASMIAILRLQSSSWFAAAFDIATQVALFAIAQRFVSLLTAPLTIVNTLLPPVVAELHTRGEIRRMERVVQAVGGLAALPCLVLLALVVLAGRPILGVLFGQHYEAAYPLLVVLCIGQVANIATGAWQVVLPMTGHRQQMLRVGIAAGAVQLASCFAGGWYAGVLGVAIGASAGAVAGNLLGMMTVRRHLSIWTFVSVRRAVLSEALALLGSRMARLVPKWARN
jgi:O-antigen/teichoic acid export membrane protein